MCLVVDDISHVLTISIFYLSDCVRQRLKSGGFTHSFEFDFMITEREKVSAIDKPNMYPISQATVHIIYMYGIWAS